MKILLLRPYSVVFTKPYFTSKPPLNLACLSAYMKHQGHEVKIQDYSLSPDHSSLREILNSYKPDLIGINAYTPNVLDGFELAVAIKAVYPGKPVVMGGPHSTSMPEETLEACSALDYIVIGEGEATFLDLCVTLQKKADVCKVSGICYRFNGSVVRSEPRPLIEDLDSLPFPDRESIAHYYRETRMFDHNLKLPLSQIMDVITSRGCTDFCTFCTVHRAYAEKGRSLRLRSAANVLSEISQAREKFGVKHVSFLDDSFTIKRDRINTIIHGLKDMDLTWNCDTRVNLVDRELIHDMVRCGCKKISIGVESGSQKVLKLINKNISLDQVRRVFGWCHEAKLETIEANFLVGSHPDETIEDVDLTRRFIKELRPQKLLASVIVPFPGTKVREQMLERKLIFTNDWRKYILKDDEPPPWRTTYFTSQELKNLQDLMLSEFYFSFRNIITTVKYIRSFSLLKSYFLSGMDVLKGYVFFQVRRVCRVPPSRKEAKAGSK